MAPDEQEQKREAAINFRATQRKLPARLRNDTALEVANNLIATLDALREAEGQRGAAGALCVEALYTDGAHHKQWYLGEVLKVLGFDLDAVRAEQMAEGYGEWEEGMVP